MTTQITVLGLGQIGTSIGLALAGHKDELLRVGNDRDMTAARQAERMGAFDKIVVNLHSAVENADVVILALAVDEIEDTVKVIADSLKPGTVVVDTSPVKVAVAEMIGKLLPAERYLVGLYPAINPLYLDESDSGVEGARADLFKNSVVAITSPPSTHSGAIQLAGDLAALLGGIAFFADPYEADGLTAATQTMPKLLAAALLHATTDQPGWREARKVAGPHYAHATHPVLTSSKSKNLGAEAMLNRENNLRMINQMMSELAALRDMLNQEDSEGLHDYLSKALESRENWLKQRLNANWETSVPKQEVPSSGQMLGRLIGLRPKKDKK